MGRYLAIISRFRSLLFKRESRSSRITSDNRSHMSVNFSDVKIAHKFGQVKLK